MNITVNRLPARTWNHLGMNEAMLKDIRIDAEGHFTAEIPDAVRVDALSSPEPAAGIFEAETKGTETAAPDELSRLLLEHKIPTHRLTAPADQKICTPARLRFACRSEEHTFNQIALQAEKNSELTVVMDFSPSETSNTAKRFTGVRTQIHAGEGALVRLVQIQQPGQGAVLYNAVQGFCEAGSRLELIQLLLDSQSTYQDCSVTLAGERSSFTADVGYLAQGEQRLDMNYAAYHQGKLTQSAISASGALKDHAFKLFRGTIDFRTGASGSEGEEKEDVLLLDDGVVNQTIPLILCAEEDVQGNHGATIGNLDENLLFYLESRGISKAAIYEMLAQARLEAVCKKITDEETRQYCLRCCRTKTEQEADADLAAADRPEPNADSSAADRLEPGSDFAVPGRPEPDAGTTAAPQS